MSLLLIGILLYVALQLLIGVFVSRKIHSESDYLLAGRSLGMGLATFSIFATWFGAETCIGTAGAAYESGWAGVKADPFGYGVCVLIVGIFFAIRLWKQKLTTIGDFFRARYSRSVEKTAVILMIPTSIMWAAAQIRAFGLVLSASSELTITLSVTIAAVVVVTYTAFGGLLADAMTDVVQGITLIIGLLVIMPFLISDTGGIEGFMGIILQERHNETNVNFLEIAETWAIPICGSLVAQELLSRVIASRSPQIAQRSSLLAAILYVSVGIIPVLIGLTGFVVLPGLSESESILPMMAQKYLTPMLYILFSGALVSAILSTVDSTLLAASSLMTHNLIIASRRDLDEKLKLRISRWGVIFMGILSYILALYAEGIYDLVKDASALGSAGIFIVFVFGLFTNWGGAYSALASLIVGTAVWIGAHYAWESSTGYLTALGAAFIVYVGIGFFEKHTKPITPN
ncbi:MAG TPA: sodium:solute symporter family protein [bacterium]|nr:sodium:solute symporter family protein [bacterium]HNH30371.1 sodium:solute symporter family protein [bacterium]HNH33326.1 sodium:solute symporter family protein [bacterium]